MLEDTLLAEFQERARLTAQRGWAAMSLAKDLNTYQAIMSGQPVIVRDLEPTRLRHGLNGCDPPGRLGYITVTTGMLEAINRAGPPPYVDTTTADFLRRAGDAA